MNERYFQQNSSLPEIHQNRDYLFIKSEYRVIRINFKDIKYIESKREYVKIFLEGSEPITTLMSIKKLEESLPDNIFMRVHRSFIVNPGQDYCSGAQQDSFRQQGIYTDQ